MALFHDITESERLEQTRRDYVANVSHELRTPLSAVRGLTPGAQRQPDQRRRRTGRATMLYPARVHAADAPDQ